MNFPSRRSLIAYGIALLTLQAQAGPLMLDAMVGQALSGAPQLTALKKSSQAQEQDALAAREWPDPKIKLGEEKLPVSNFRATDQTMDVIGVEQMIPGGKKLTLASQANLLSASRLRADEALSRLTIRRDAAFAWLDAVYARAQVRLLKQQLDQAGKGVDAQRRALIGAQGGVASVLDAERLRLLLNDKLQQALADQHKADAQVARWAGQVELPDTLPEISSPPTLAMLEAWLERHPAILIREQETALAQNAVDQARENKKPDWDFELSYGRARTPGMPNTLTAMVTFSLPIRPGARQDRQAAARQLDLDATGATREADLRSLRADLEAAYTDWLSLNRRLAELDAGLSSRADALVASNVAGYANGALPFSQLITSRQNRLDDAMTVLALRYQRVRARIALDYFVPSAASFQEQ
ncbi:TolC family protein [Paludibacterium purpuratum]|uniref:Outer membrane protein TolC n=1 Tax=Paludibacterium purpuratum TaxID=1144873 RepID=A0A4R7B4C9_9NEIS|nr:TolC family protein [Paludibacterium purpuratum]TDR77834.1 outer membrane protein TolC [Paludibacterium purpuratum]